MKIYHFTAALAVAFMLCSCQERIDSTEQETNKTATLTLDAGSLMFASPTKSINPADFNETKINNVQLLVFNSAGNIEAYKSSSSASASTTVLCGRKTIAAVCNTSSDLSGVKTLASFREMKSTLSGNGKSSFEMIGIKENYDIYGDSTLTMPVRRFMSKVIVKKITRNFSNADEAKVEMKLTGLWLSNVVGDINYAVTSSYAPTTWYNKLGWHNDSSMDAFLYDSLNKTIANGTNYTPSNPHVFYCYPNASTNDTKGGSWSARYTRLVLSAEIAGKQCYYPINLPGLAANKYYQINNITLTKAGSSDPDDPSKDIEIDIDFNVNFTPAEWEAGNSWDITY